MIREKHFYLCLTLILFIVLTTDNKINSKYDDRIFPHASIYHNYHYSVTPPHPPRHLNKRKCKRKNKHHNHKNKRKNQTTRSKIVRAFHKTTKPCTKYKTNLFKPGLYWNCTINKNLLFLCTLFILIMPVNSEYTLKQSALTSFHLVPTLVAFAAAFIKPFIQAATPVKAFKLKIFSQNINRGIYDKYHLVNELVLHSQFDIINLQEVGVPKTHTNNLPKLFPTLDTYSKLHKGTTQYIYTGSKLGTNKKKKAVKTNNKYKWGVCTLLSKELGEYTTVLPSPKNDGRILTLKIDKPSLPTIININIYAPSGNVIKNLEFTETILTYIKKLKKEHEVLIFVSGDFNSVANNYLDSNNPNYNNANINTLLENEILTDTFRTTHPTTIAHTHSQTYKNNTFKKRLDYTLVSQNAIPYLTKAKIGHKREIPSDHRSVRATFIVPLQHEITCKRNPPDLPLEDHFSSFLRKQTAKFTNKDWSTYNNILDTLITNNTRNINNLTNKLTELTYNNNTTNNTINTLNSIILEAIFEVIDQKAKKQNTTLHNILMDHILMLSKTSRLPRGTNSVTQKLKNKTFDLIKIRRLLKQIKH